MLENLYLLYNLNYVYLSGHLLVIIRPLIGHLWDFMSPFLFYLFSHTIIGMFLQNPPHLNLGRTIL